MIPKRDWFSLFYPEPLDGVDIANLRTCGVRRVQVFFRTAQNRPQMLQQLAAMGIRVILRLEEPSKEEPLEATYYGANAWLWVRMGLLQVMQAVAVEAVIVGNEPEHDYDLTWRSANWGNNADGKWRTGKAWQHAQAFEQVRRALADVPVKVISPGWSCQRLTPNDAPQPGRATWGRICADAYNGTFVANPQEAAKIKTGAHIYVHNWLGEEDRNRFKWEFGNELERCHRAIWINECNANNGEHLQRMQAILEMSDLIRSHAEGDRVESFCPFVSNGLGNAYPIGYIMREAECYQRLGAWMNS